MRDKIIEMLGKGISATQVAAAVGCDDSYVSQLMSDETVASEVARLRAEHFAIFVEQDAKLDDAEAQALQRLQTLVPFITKPSEAARVYSVLNAAKRRTHDSINAAQAPAQTVVLDLPQASRVALTVTHDRQVIEIAGRSMTTMPAKSLAAQLEQRNAARLLSAEVPATLLNASQQPISKDRAPSYADSKKHIPLVKQL